MLADPVLADLVQKGPLREHLVAMAWPSLGVAERLQLIQAIQADCASADTPPWLLVLALGDTAPLVRYWAARHATFAVQKPVAVAANHAEGPAAEIALDPAQRVRGDAQEMVRACLTGIQAGAEKEFTRVSQLARLVALRKVPACRISAVVDWLAAAVMSRVPGNELRDCAAEFFGRVDVAAELRNDDFEDPTDAHTAGETLRKAWALVRVADATVDIELARALPLSRGMYTIDMAELLDYPVPVLRELVLRASQEPAMTPLITLLVEQGESLPEDLRVDLAQINARLDADVDQEASNLRAKPDRQRAILDAILALRIRIDTLEASVVDAEKARAGKLPR
jgi:hypothetical protein